jgi:6-phosphogluconate dehydrogenase (decarboxylating)
MDKLFILNTGEKAAGLMHKAEEVEKELIELDAIFELQHHEGPRRVWLDEITNPVTLRKVCTELGKYLQEGDYVLSAGPVYFKDDLVIAESLAASGVHYCDLAVIDGISGKVVLFGGEEEHFEECYDMLRSLEDAGICHHAGKVGSAHFSRDLYEQCQSKNEMAIREAKEKLVNSPFNEELNLTELLLLFYRFGYGFPCHLVLGKVNYVEYLNVATPQGLKQTA